MKPEHCMTSFVCILQEFQGSDGTALRNTSRVEKQRKHLKPACKLLGSVQQSYILQGSFHTADHAAGAHTKIKQQVTEKAAKLLLLYQKNTPEPSPSRTTLAQ